MSILKNAEIPLAAIPADDRLLTPEVWVKIIVLGALFVLLFEDFFWRMSQIAFKDADWSHALVLPLISLYYLYQNSDRISQAKPKTNWFGLVLLLAGFALYVVGIVTPFKHIVVTGYGMILALGGLILFMTGWQVSRHFVFPVAFLTLGVRLPDQYWDLLAFKLQYIAAQSATVMIQVLGIPLGVDADVNGQTIMLFKDSVPIDTPLHVAGACSGLRMLMAFIALGTAVAFLTRRPRWSRLIMVAMTIPIAIFINVCRVTTLGLIHPFNDQMSSGDFHTLVGMLMLIPGLLLFMLLGWVLDQFIPFQDDQPKPPKPAAAATPTAQPAAGGGS